MSYTSKEILATQCRCTVCTNFPFHCIGVRQITVAAIDEEKKDEFMEKVRQALTRPPWNMESPVPVQYSEVYYLYIIQKRQH